MTAEPFCIHQAVFMQDAFTQDRNVDKNFAVPDSFLRISCI